MAKAIIDLSTELNAGFIKFTKRTGCSRSDLVRLAVCEYLKKWGYYDITE